MLLALLFASLPQRIEPTHFGPPPQAVVLSLVPRADGERLSTALVAVKGIDPDQPWLSEVETVLRDGTPKKYWPRGGGHFRVHAGARLAVAAMDPSRGCVEEELVVPIPGADGPLWFLGGTPAVLIELELPDPVPPGDITLQGLPARGWVEVSTPRFGVKWRSMERLPSDEPRSVHRQLPRGDYRFHVTAPSLVWCADGGHLPDRRGWIGQRVAVTGEAVEVDCRGSSRCAPMTIRVSPHGLSAAGATGATGLLGAQPRSPGDPYLDLAPWSGEWPGPAEARELVTISIRPLDSDGVLEAASMLHPRFEIGPPTRCLVLGEPYITERSFAPGDYELKVQGPGALTKLVRVRHDLAGKSHAIQITRR